MLDPGGLGGDLGRGTSAGAGDRRGGALLEDRLAREHRQLEALFEELAWALETGRPAAEARAAFTELAETLEVHFEQEDRLYYPAIGGLRPELEGRLAELAERHQWFLDQLRRLGDHLRHEDTAGAWAVFRSLSDAFAAHESAEDEILQQIARLRSGSPAQ